MNIKPEKTTAPRNASKQNSRQQKKKTPKKITETYLHNSGLYYLQRFSASSGQFREVMLRKVKKSCLFHKDQNYKNCAEMVDQLVIKFEEVGLLNDTLYVQGVVNSMRRAGKSKKAIFAKLMAKYIAKDSIEEAVSARDIQEHEDTYEAEKQAAYRFAQKKKLGPFQKDTARIKENHHQKSLASLARAGFSYDIAKSVLEENG